VWGVRCDVPCVVVSVYGGGGGCNFVVGVYGVAAGVVVASCVTCVCCDGYVVGGWGIAVVVAVVAIYDIGGI